MERNRTSICDDQQKLQLTAAFQLDNNTDKESNEPQTTKETIHELRTSELHIDEKSSRSKTPKERKENEQYFLQLTIFRNGLTAIPFPQPFRQTSVILNK